MSGKKQSAFMEREKNKFSRIVKYLLIITIVAFVFFRLTLKIKLNARLKAIRASGYPVTCQELDKWYTLPREENIAYYVLDAFDSYREGQNEELLPVWGQGELPGRTEIMSEEMRNHISQYLDENKESLNYLHKINKFRYSRYPIDLSPGIFSLLPQLTKVRKCVFLLQLEAVGCTEENDSNGTTDSIKSIISASNSLSNEPVILSQSVRFACLNRALLSLEYSMNRIEFTQEQLLELTQFFKKSENSLYLKRAFIGARCQVLDTFKNILSLPTDFSEELPPKPVLAICKALGIMDMDEINYLDFMEEYINACELPLNEQINAFDTIEVKQENMSGFFMLSRLFMSSYNRTFTRHINNIAEIKIATAALAIERFRLQNNKLPDSLSDLVPGFLNSIPLDPYGGKELKYKKLDKGFVVYSIGEDQLDDNGREEPKNNTQKKNNTWDITFVVEK